jgi:hypothetical protein
MQITIGDMREVVGPLVRFTLTLTDDKGEALMIYPGWTLNVYRDVQPPATKTAKGFWKRFTEISSVFERQLREALETFPEVERVLGPRQKRVRSQAQIIVGEKEVAAARPRRGPGKRSPSATAGVTPSRAPL